MANALLIPAYIVSSPLPFLPAELAAAIGVLARRLLGLKCEVDR